MPSLLNCPRLTIKTTCLGCVALAFAFVTVTNSMQAQNRTAVEPTIKKGTLVEVTKKGRIQVLKYTDEAGEEQELLITAKIQVQVQAAGDAGFLQSGQFIRTIATESNQMLFADELTVYLFGKGRVPGGKIQKAPPKAGQSQNAYQVTGTIIAIGQDKDYPEYRRAEIKAAGPRAPLMIEKDAQVTVMSGDLSLAAAGTPIELEGTELRNGRFNAKQVTAKLKEPLKADDVLGAPADEKGKKPAGKE